MKYLELCNEWSKTGVLPGGNGLCGEFNKRRTKPRELGSRCWDFRDNPLFELFIPIYPKKEFYIPHNGRPAFWAHRGPIDHIHDQFGPLRQNIVLLMAAMNGEL